ncbi:MAG TPA: adenylate/guanylate cyclase domain-containing protein [Xanthobacteraceae bacterium]|nr:adenylate/guanylate cyclase domain-containing protein [Xanthobacteraceae bacterium]
MHAPPPCADLTDPFAELLTWIIQRGMSETALEELLEGFCERLVRAGLPLSRVAVAMPMVDPTFRAITTIWRRGTGAVLEQTRHSAEGDSDFAASPIADLIGRDETTARYLLREREGVERFPLLRRLHAEGGTDYFMRLLRYPSENAVLGAAFSMTSDAPAGFAPADIARVDALLPALGLAAYRIALTLFARHVLSFYLGARSAERVLAGEILRGSGETIRSAIFFADVRSFTTISASAGPAQTIAWLDDVFERLGDAVDARGGEILKFIGDGVLAIFPLDEHDRAGCDACARSLLAATSALASIEALAERQRQAGLPVLKVDIALHVGDIYYGNIGAARRLDFTAIGSAVNEVARMEKLCDTLGVHLLFSQAFAAQLSTPVDLLGTFELRGVADPFAVYSLPDARR